MATVHRRRGTLACRSQEHLGNEGNAMTLALELEVLERQLSAEIEVRRSSEQRARGERAQVVAVVGLGSVGLATAIALRAAGARIVGIDASRRRLQAIRNGEVELSDDDREELGRCLRDRHFHLTRSTYALAAADLVLVCISEPIGQHARCSQGTLKEACEAVVKNARPGQTIVLGTVASAVRAQRLLVRPLLAKGLRVGEDVVVAFVPATQNSRAMPAPPRGRARLRRR
jgi:UDP-N-acetyl-D-mannosaminuronate dehydrogenase